MTNKYDNLRLNVILDRISNHDILTKAADVICRMRENLDCLDFIYIPADCVDDMDYVIAASIVFIFILRNFSYKKFLQSAL